MTERYCGKCKQDLNSEMDNEKVLYCVSCRSHFHSSCINVTELNISQWICPICTSVNTLSSNDDVKFESVTQEGQQELFKMMKRTNSKIEKMESLVKEAMDTKKPIAMMLRNMNELKATLAHLEEEMTRVQMENSRLQTKYGNVWRSMLRLEDTIGDLQQYRNGNTALVVTDAQVNENDDMWFFSNCNILVWCGVIHGICSLIIFYFFVKYFKKEDKKMNKLNDPTLENP